MGIFIGDHHFFQITEDSLLGSAHLYGQEFLLLAAVDSQDAVACHFGNRLFVAVVILIDGLGFLVPRRGNERSFFHCEVTDMDPVIRLVRNGLCQNVSGSVQGILHREDFFFLRKKSFGIFLQRTFCQLQADEICQGLQTFFLRDRRSGPPFRTIGAVEIVHHHKSLCCQDLLFQLRCQLALLFYHRKNLLLFLLQIPEIGQPFKKFS